MILSMTGYGKGRSTSGDATYVVELKSLNGKTSDVRCRIPNHFKEKELALRQMVLDHAHRGKIDLLIEVESEKGDSEYAINTAAFKKYYKDLKALKEELDMEQDIDFVQAILRIPNVIWTKTESLEDNVWQAVQSAVREALENLQNFRKEDGKVMHDDLQEKVKEIQTQLDEISPYEEDRISNLKERFRRNLDDFIKNDKLDHNRYEQEIIYYLEKLDINEEKVRLAQHCDYFLKVLESDDIQVGKKLSFIAQEMGREINTLGAKAQEKNIQRIVVNMKDALEKIKEQLSNIV